MAKYKQIRRNGRWITVDESGKEVGVGQGYLRDVARSIRDIGVYSDKTDKQGNPLTIRQAKDQASTPKPKPKPKPKPAPSDSSNSKPKPKPKPAPAEVKPSTPSVRASEQRTTTTRPPAAKSESKADSKPAAKASETYREGGKGLYQGTQEYRDKVGGSGNPLLERFKKDMNSKEDLDKAQEKAKQESLASSKNKKLSDQAQNQLKINKAKEEDASADNAFKRSRQDVTALSNRATLKNYGGYPGAPETESEPKKKDVSDVSNPKNKPHPKAVWRKDLKRWVVNK